MKRREAREEKSRMQQQQQTNSRFTSTLVIAAVRLAREENINRPSPRVLSGVADSITLAHMILDGVLRRFPPS